MSLRFVFLLQPRPNDLRFSSRHFCISAWDMITPHGDKPKTDLDAIPPLKWLLLAVALSVTGSVLITLAMGLLDLWRSQSDASAAKASYVHPSLDVLYYFGTYSLIINLLGASFLVGFFFVGKRLRR